MTEKEKELFANLILDSLDVNCGCFNCKNAIKKILNSVFEHGYITGQEELKQKGEMKNGS